MSKKTAMRRCNGASRLGVLATALALVMLGSVAAAQEEPAPAAPEPEAEAEATPQPPRTDSNAGTDDVFIPSEEIAADEEVTFPVDI